MAAILPENAECISPRGKWRGSKKQVHPAVGVAYPWIFYFLTRYGGNGRFRFE